MKILTRVCNYLRWSASWALYWVGHLVSIPMTRWGHLYYVYNPLMLWSCCVQGDTERGPWRRARQGCGTA